MSSQTVYVCLTCDVEGDPTKWAGDLAKLVNVANKHQAKVTFFVSLDEGRSSLPKYKRIYSTLHSFEEEGHEVGLHIHWGSWHVESKIKEDFNKGVKLCKSYTNSLRSFTKKELKEELEYYLNIMQELGFSPHSFRGGGLCQTTACLEVLAEHGFEVDSSVSSGLNEKGGWFQNHISVPRDRGFYYPSKIGYDLPAKSEEERIGILEVPVTSTATPDGSLRFLSEELTVKSFMQFYEWAVSHQKGDSKVLTFICHNWTINKFDVNLLRQSMAYAFSGPNRLRIHSKFISALENILTYIKDERVRYVTMRGLKDELL